MSSITDFYPQGGTSNKHSQQLTSWTLDSTSYYCTVIHNLNSLNVIAQVRYTDTKKIVIPEDIEIIDADTLKVWMDNNSDDLTIVVS